MRFLSGRRVNLSHSFSDDEESLALSAVAVSVYEYAGTTPVTTGAASVASGVYSFLCPPLDTGVYYAEWAGTDSGGAAVATDVTYFEVTGGPIFTVKDARNSDSELVDAADYPASEIIHYREVVETEFQTITGRSFVPRTTVVDVVTDGDDETWVGLFDCDGLRAATDPTGADVRDSLTLDSNGLLSGLCALPTGTRVRLTIDYGFREVPADIKRVALLRLRFLLAAESSGVPDRATSYVSDTGGTFTLATPGRGGYKIGIPDVDAVLNLYTYTVFNSIVTVP